MDLSIKKSIRLSGHGGARGVAPSAPEASSLLVALKLDGFRTRQRGGGGLKSEGDGDKHGPKPLRFMCESRRITRITQELHELQIGGSTLGFISIGAPIG